MVVEEQTPLRLVGKRFRRADSPERLTGQVRYTGDLVLPGLLYGRLVRSPYASARIVSVDKSAAEAMPGVVAVLRAEDLPVVNLRAAVENRSIMMAFERATYVGQPVAVVLAESEAAAEDGAEGVQVEYEPLSPAVDMLHAMQADSPVVRMHADNNNEELAMHGAAGGGSEQEAPQAPNVASHQRYSRGDVDKAFREADVIVEREYRTPWVHQSYMEPQVCAATVDALGNVVVYACTQAMFRTRDTVATVLGKSTSQVRVHAMPVGGGFGGKFGLIEPLVAACSVAVGRPVRLAFTRVEDFSAACPAPSSIFRVKAAARKDGTFTALKGEVIFDAGAKPGAPAAHAALCLGVFYRWENLDIDATEVVTHKTPTGAYRAPGLPQAMFAGESIVDELIGRLGLDQLAVRKKNAARGGDIRPDGTPWPAIGLAECLERAEPIYRAELAAAGPNEGVGVALGGWFGGTEPASALCRLESDGTLKVSIGSVDLTGTNNGLQIIAAEAFGMDSIGEVRVSTVDTEAAPYSGATGGSKTIYTMGPAVLKAAQEARERVMKIAASELEASVDDLELVHGEVRVKGVPGKVKTLQRDLQIERVVRRQARTGARQRRVGDHPAQSGHGRAHCARAGRPRDGSSRATALRGHSRRWAGDQSRHRRGADPRWRRARRRLGRVRRDRPRRVGHADDRQLHGLHRRKGQANARARSSSGRSPVVDWSIRSQTSWGTPSDSRRRRDRQRSLRSHGGARNGPATDA